MKSRNLIMSGSLALFVPAASLSQPAPQAAAAVIMEASGKLELQSGSTARPIDNAKDRSRALQVGDVVTCKEPTARFKVFDGGLIKEITGTPCMHGYIVSPPGGKYTSALSEYGRTGGRPRGSMLGLLLWPVSGALTTPATASQLQWRKQSSGTLTATLKEAGTARVLWTRSGIDAALGALRAPDLESALRAQVDAGRTSALLDIHVSDSLNASATITLLDRAAEQMLQQALAAAGADLSGDALHLVRADIFLERSLPREALEEYLAMLEGSPESVLLLTKASALAVEISDPRAADLVRRARAAGGS